MNWPLFNKYKQSSYHIPHTYALRNVDGQKQKKLACFGIRFARTNARA